MRRLAEAREQVATWRGLEVKVGELSDLLEMAEAEGDEAMAADVSAEVEALAARLDELELSLALSGEYDRRDAILAIHAGAGGTDSQDWADMLLRMYLRWAEGHGYQARVLDMTVGEEAGIKSAMAEVVEACPAPLVVAGGGKKSVRETFQLVRDSVDVGAIGIAMGRNLWGADDPVKMVQAMCAIVHEDASVDDAMGMI